MAEKIRLLKLLEVGCWLNGAAIEIEKAPCQVKSQGQITELVRNRVEDRVVLRDVGSEASKKARCLQSWVRW